MVNEGGQEIVRIILSGNFYHVLTQSIFGTLKHEKFKTEQEALECAAKYTDKPVKVERT